MLLFTLSFTQSHKLNRISRMHYKLVSELKIVTLKIRIESIDTKNFASLLSRCGKHHLKHTDQSLSIYVFGKHIKVNQNELIHLHLLKTISEPWAPPVSESMQRDNIPIMPFSCVASSLTSTDHLFMHPSNVGSFSMLFGSFILHGDTGGWEGTLPDDLRIVDVPQHKNAVSILWEGGRR